MIYKDDMKKTDARSLSAKTQEEIRIKAVQAVLNGMTQKKAAAVFGVARPTVAKWLSMYRKGGMKVLKARQQGRPKGHKKIKGWQAGITVRTITDKTPEQLKMPFVLWARDSVQEFLEERFQIIVSVSTVGRWLKAWGFTPQKPLRRAIEQNPVDVQKWLNQEYPHIKQEAKKEDAEIHWGDEMGMRSDHQAFRSYGKKGQTPVIQGTGQRFGCNMISTITNLGTLRFKVFHGSFTTKVFIDFLGRLIRNSKRKIYLIVDRHSVHKSKAVKKWLEQNKNRIRMFFLPAYSPELNPDEMLNNDVKANAVGRRRPRHLEEMEDDVRGYLRRTQRNPKIVKSYFRAKNVCYAED